MKCRLLSLLSLLWIANGLWAAELNVFAAASLTDALKEIAPLYEKQSGDHLHFNLGASSVLALQIKQGAPADLFFSADDAKMEALAKAGLILPETRKALLSNTLVVVVPVQGALPTAKPEDLVSVGRLALAEPKTVPAGIYAKTWLTSKGLWEKVSAKVIPTENVRACLAAVEAGNADAGIVFKTDALISKKVKIAYEVPAAETPGIVYPLAVVKDSKNPDAARRLAAYLAGDEAGAVFAKFGFLK